MGRLVRRLWRTIRSVRSRYRVPARRGATRFQRIQRSRGRASGFDGRRVPRCLLDRVGTAPGRSVFRESHPKGTNGLHSRQPISSLQFHLKRPCRGGIHGASSIRLDSRKWDHAELSLASRRNLVPRYQHRLGLQHPRWSLAPRGKSGGATGFGEYPGPYFHRPYLVISASGLTPSIHIRKVARWPTRFRILG